MGESECELVRVSDWVNLSGDTLVLVQDEVSECECECEEMPRND